MADSNKHDDYCLPSYGYKFSPELLKGRVAFITGGGSGIGFRIAELFMRHGCDIVIASRNLAKLEEVRCIYIYICGLGVPGGVHEVLGTPL